MELNRRKFLQIGGGAIASSLAPFSASAGSSRSLPWAERAGLELYRAGPRAQHEISMVYFGTPNKLSDVSCGDDLMWMERTVQRIESMGVHVNPIFVFPNDTVPREQWGNVADYIDKAGSVYTAYSGRFEDIKSSFQKSGEELVLFTARGREIKKHTSYVSVIAPDGEVLVAGLADMDLSAQYVSKIQGHCQEPWIGSAPEYCD